MASLVGRAVALATHTAARLTAAPVYLLTLTRLCALQTLVAVLARASSDGSTDAGPSDAANAHAAVAARERAREHDRVVAVYVLLSVSAPVVLWGVYACGPVMALVLLTAALAHASRNLVTLPVVAFGVVSAWCAAPLWVPLWYVGGGVSCLLCVGAVWSATALVLVTHGTLCRVLLRVYAHCCTVRRHPPAREQQLTEQPNTPAVISAAPGTTATATTGAAPTGALGLHAAPHRDVGLDHKHDDDATGSGSSDDGTGVPGATAQQQPLYGLAQLLSTPAPAQQQRPLSGSSSASSLAPVPEDDGDDGRDRVPVRQRLQQPHQLHAAASAAPTAASSSHADADATSTSLAHRGRISAVVQRVRHAVRDGGTRAVARATRVWVAWVHERAYACDPLGVRLPYALPQDMALEVHRAQLALGWRHDRPRAADYPHVAMYVQLKY